MNVRSESSAETHMSTIDAKKSRNEPVTFQCARSEAVCYYRILPFLGFERHNGWIANTEKLQ